MSQIKPGLEPAAQESVEATANPPYLFEWSMRIWPIPFANGVGFLLAEDVAASCGGGFDGVGVAKGVDHDEVMADPLVAHRGHGDALRRQFAQRTPSPRSDSPKTQGENMPTFTGATTVPLQPARSISSNGSLRRRHLTAVPVPALRFQEGLYLGACERWIDDLYTAFAPAAEGRSSVDALRDGRRLHPDHARPADADAQVLHSVRRPRHRPHHTQRLAQTSSTSQSKPQGITTYPLDLIVGDPVRVCASRSGRPVLIYPGLVDQTELIVPRCRRGGDCWRVGNGGRVRWRSGGPARGPAR
jgi:hypothetical protein